MSRAPFRTTVTKSSWPSFPSRPMTGSKPSASTKKSRALSADSTVMIGMTCFALALLIGLSFRDDATVDIVGSIADTFQLLLGVENPFDAIARLRGAGRSRAHALRAKSGDRTPGSGRGR